MGTYKVFNGTDWVNICDCQVHVRNASNDWQLLDPANCVTKYWTGAEWCEIICAQPCECINGEVAIGSQIWKCSNLNVTTYSNGDVIPQVTDPTQWGNLTTGAWCYYNNDPSTEAVYGKLYNHFAVKDSRGLAPTGWHVPTNTEWDTLTSYLGGLPVAGGKMKEVGTTNWNSPNTGATNSSCFTAVPGGRREFTVGAFSDINTKAYYWTSSIVNFDRGDTRILHFNNSYVTYGNLAFESGCSVRIVKD
jgi:uncharacterized protein (TIGR02145 family)